MISLLVYLIILLLVFSVAWWIIDLVPFIPLPFKNIVKAIVALILLLVLISALFGGLSLPPVRLQ